MIIIVKFPSELHVKFVTKLRYAFLDMFRLYSEILVIVKANLHNNTYLVTLCYLKNKLSLDFERKSNKLS